MMVFESLNRGECRDLSRLSGKEHQTQALVFLISRVWVRILFMAHDP